MSLISDPILELCISDATKNDPPPFPATFYFTVLISTDGFIFFLKKKPSCSFSLSQINEFFKAVELDILHSILYWRSLSCRNLECFFFKKNHCLGKGNLV